MKKIIVVFLLCCSVAIGQQKNVTKLGDFTTIKVFSGLEVELIPSNDAKVIVTGSKSDQVSIKNKNGVLKFSLKYTDGFKKGDVAIQVYYLNEIDVLDANEGSYIYSDKVLNQQHLELKTQEGAIIDVDINVKYLTIKSVSGGSINASGTTQNQTVDTNSGGIYSSYDLESKQATASASAGGIIKVNVSEMLDASVNFGGSIFYKGNPEEVKTKKVIGGKIQSK